MQQSRTWLALAGLAVVLAAVVGTTACSTVWSSKLAPDAAQTGTTLTPVAHVDWGVPIPPPGDSSYATTKDLPSMGFWAVWGPADRSESVVRPVANRLRAEGFEAGIVYTPEWQGLSLSPWYVVCIGPYPNKAVALKALKAAQSRGHKGFHVMFSGPTTMDQGASWVRNGVRP